MKRKTPRFNSYDPDPDDDEAFPVVYRTSDDNDRYGYGPDDYDDYEYDDRKPLYGRKYPKFVRTCDDMPVLEKWIKRTLKFVIFVVILRVLWWIAKPLRYAIMVGSFGILAMWFEMFNRGGHVEPLVWFYLKWMVRFLGFLFYAVYEAVTTYII